jgi:hypothetical protein
MEIELEESEKRLVNNKNDEPIESKNELQKKPKSVPYILVSVLLERFCTAGVIGRGKS